jgi:hypothetical protein
VTDRPSVNVHAILLGLFSVAHTPEGAEHAARTVLEIHAHELAQQQRAEADRRQAHEVDRFGRLDHETALQLDAVRDAANFIDPKAQDASTEGDTP